MPECGNQMQEEKDGRRYMVERVQGNVSVDSTDGTVYSTDGTGYPQFCTDCWRRSTEAVLGQRGPRGSRVGGRVGEPGAAGAPRTESGSKEPVCDWDGPDRASLMPDGTPPAASKVAFEGGRSVMKPPLPESAQGRAVPAAASGAGGDGPSETLAASSGVGVPGEGPPKRQKVDQSPEKAARDGEQPAAPAAPSAPSANQQGEGENGKEVQPIQPDQSLAQAAGVKAGEQSGSRGPDPSAVQVRARGPDPSPVQGKATKVVRKRKEPEASAAWPGHPFPRERSKGGMDVQLRRILTPCVYIRLAQMVLRRP